MSFTELLLLELTLDFYSWMHCKTSIIFMIRFLLWGEFEMWGLNQPLGSRIMVLCKVHKPEILCKVWKDPVRK